MSVRTPTLRLLAKLSGLALALSVLALIAACGSGDEARTPTPEATPAITSTAPAASPTVEPTAPAVSDAFPGLPLDKLTAMDYDAEAHRMTLTTTLARGAVTEGEQLCRAFIAVALFAPDASIDVLASDSSFLARCQAG